MEKLIELLNEYEVIRIKEANNKEEVGNLDRYIPYRYTKQVIEGFSNTIISKKYGFIKRLVDRDKIDLYTILKENGTFRKEFYAIENKKEYERLIMLLSVEEKPISFLLSILK